MTIFIMANGWEPDWALAELILPSRTLSADLSLIRDICNELGPDPAVAHEVKGASRVGLHGLSVKTDSPALEALASLQFA